MTHTIGNKDKLVARVRRIKGQVEAIERALASEAGCERVMHLLASTRAAFTSLSIEVIEDHVRNHMVPRGNGDAGLPDEAADRLLATLRSYVR